eukprot:gnl/TRDRNA2_/TRDRNA2_151344_c0_seq1.p2 gnl/TRDRNA2_/TRDRNA2_151344_c0~~gnl/TRDRNA2_/TRDRNA2_151344_c0_seq1.p2  ORF type:complete len:103 (-),score=1.77 gnl/TRDRNA2_/TRDRNA2_151344_c0_seq1:53-361(-)
MFLERATWPNSTLHPECHDGQLMAARTRSGPAYSESLNAKTCITTRQALHQREIERDRLRVMARVTGSLLAACRLVCLLPGPGKVLIMSCQYSNGHIVHHVE